MELRPQFEALCKAINLDPASPDILSTLREPTKVSWKSLTKVIENDLVVYGTFRGSLDGSWLATEPDPMTWQRSGGFADGLRRAGVKSIVVGDLIDEWYLYSIAHPIKSPKDITPNLQRYYPDHLVDLIQSCYRKLGDDASEEESARLFGDILSDGQVHLPVRLLARDLFRSGFPVLRYEVRWTPEQVRERTKGKQISHHGIPADMRTYCRIGYVTHGTDRPLWAYRVPTLKANQLGVARQWIATIDEEISALEHAGKPLRSVQDILTLKEDRSITWTEDKKYAEIMRLTKVLPGET